MRYVLVNFGALQIFNTKKTYLYLITFNLFQFGMFYEILLDLLQTQNA